MKTPYIPPSIRTGAILNPAAPPRRPRSKKKRIQNKWTNKMWDYQDAAFDEAMKLVVVAPANPQVFAHVLAAQAVANYLSGSNSDFLGLGLGII